MRRTGVVWLAVALALLGLAAGGRERSEARGAATLKLARGAPLTLRGERFVPGEHVRVTVKSERTAAKRVTASSSGVFVVRFRGVAYDRCHGLVAVAVGSRGSRATLKRPELLCPPRL